MTSKLDQLKQMTDVVADTGDIEAMRVYQPLDATTNPSLLLKASALPQYGHLLDDARAFGAKHNGSDRAAIDACADRLAVLVGKEITDIIPGRVSTEVDARLSFDTRATVERAKTLIGYYEALGIGSERVLIKVAATWEGIRAAEQLEQAGIQCNLTLLFGFEQAAACADAGVFLVSPFVGRILDWWKQATGETYTSQTDPGVLSVRRIYRYFKSHGFKTVVMGASFRNTGEIEALAGCDRLTISPALLAELDADVGDLPRQLDPEATSSDDAKFSPEERDFRWGLNGNAMATEKLAEGIRLFARDQVELERVLTAGG